MPMIEQSKEPQTDRKPLEFKNLSYWCVQNLNMIPKKLRKALDGSHTYTFKETYIFTNIANK